MKSLEQLRNQMSVMPCRFASQGGAEKLPLSSETVLSLAGGFPSANAQPPPEEGDGAWILRGDVNSVGCLASDELFFRQTGGVHTFDERMIVDAGEEVAVTAITANSRTYVRNASFDVTEEGNVHPSYYGWTDIGDIVYTSTANPTAASQLFKVEPTVEYTNLDGMTVTAYTPVDDSDPDNIVLATITFGGGVSTRDKDADVKQGNVTVYFGWSGGFYTQYDSPAVVGQPILVQSQTGITAEPLGYLVDSITEEYVGGGYPKDAILEHAIMPWSLKVMSVVTGTTVDFNKDDTALLTEKNWRFVEPDKDFDPSLAVCQVDWSGLEETVSGRFYEYYKRAHPWGYFAKDGGATLISAADRGVAGLVIALKDNDEVKGY